MSKCQNLNSLFREINFLEFSKYFWNLQMSTMIEKLKVFSLTKQFKNWHAFWLMKFKNWHVFWRVDPPIWKIGTPLGGFLWRWHAGTLKWNVPTLDHASTHDTHGTRYKKLVKLHEFLPNKKVYPVDILNGYIK